MFDESDLFAPPPPPKTANAKGVALCEFDGLTIAIPQADILTIEHGSELSAPLDGERVIGWFESKQGPWPVYALDRRLELSDDAHLQRAFLVFLNDAPTPTGILCEAVRILGDVSELKAQPLPEPIRSAAPPDTRIASADHGVCLCFGDGFLRTHVRGLDSARRSLPGAPDATVIHDVRAWRHAAVVDSAPVSPAPTLSAPVRAWLLDWPPQPLAFALCEVIEVIDAPQSFELPFGPSWCRAVLFWRDRFIALAADQFPKTAGHVVVTAFQRRSREALQYAAFAIEGTPRQITVNDGADCEPPLGVFNGAQLRASFEFERRAVVVPELASLFASESAQ